MVTGDGTGMTQGRSLPTMYMANQLTKLTLCSGYAYGQLTNKQNSLF